MKVIKRTTKYLCVLIAFVMTLFSVQNIMVRHGEVQDRTYAKDEEKKDASCRS